MITVMGATGRVGRQVVALLRSRGEEVRAVGRSPERLAALGAPPYPGDAADAAYLTRAFRDAEAVFTMLPAEPQAPDHRAAQDAKGEATTGSRTAGNATPTRFEDFAASLAPQAVS